MAFPIENFLSPNLTNMLITFVIPFLIIFAVLSLVLSRTRIFGKSISLLISFGLTIMIYAIKPATFAFLASYLFQIGVIGSIIAFVMFLFVFLWFFVKGGIRIARVIGGDQQKLQELEKMEQKLQKKYYSGGIFGSNVGQRLTISKELEQIEKEKKFLLAKMRRLR